MRRMASTCSLGSLDRLGKCALARFLALGIPIGLTEQNGGFGVAVGHDIDVHGYYIHYISIYNNNKYNTHGYQLQAKITPLAL